MNLASKILDFAKTLIGLKSTIRAEQMANRQRLADHLDRVATCSEEVAHDLQGRYLVLERDEWEARGAGYRGAELGG